MFFCISGEHADEEEETEQSEDLHTDSAQSEQSREEHRKAGDGDVIRCATLLNEDQSKTCCVRIQSQTFVSR